MFIQTLSLAALVGAVGPQTTPQKDKASATQERRADMQPTRYQTARFADLEEIADAKVLLMADFEERADAAEKGERADRPEGSIDDLLIDHEDGRIVGAVVSVGGFLGIGNKKVAVPYEALTWSATDEAFMLSATEEQLKSQVEFDADRARKDGVDALMLKSSRPIESGARKDKAHEDDMHKGDTRKGDAHDDGMHDDQDGDAHAMGDKHAAKGMTSGDKRLTPVASGLCLASKLDGKAIHGRDDKFGDVSRLIVDRESGEIEFVVVSRGGVAGMGDEKYLLPFEALTYCRADDGQARATAAGYGTDRLDDDKGERVLCIERTTADLEAGVQYEEPEEGILDVDAARQANERFSGRG